MRLLFVAAAVLAAACGDSAVVVEIRADGLEVPRDLDAFCLAVADTDPGGVEFARRYLLGDGEDAVGDLPQTLVVEPGAASRAELRVRGFRGGLEVARDRRQVGFSGAGEAALTLSRCQPGSGDDPEVVASAEIAAGTRAVASAGRGGTLVVAVTPAEGAIFRAAEGGWEELDLAAPSTGDGAGPKALVAFDADGDCDDDVLVARQTAPPVLWRREADGSFSEAAEALPESVLSPARAAAAADVDGDGDLDLATGGASQLVVLVNDGTGSFDPHPTPISGDAGSDVTALAFGDLEGDGDVDLAVGRGEGTAVPARVLFNAGGGAMQAAPAALPEVPLQVRSLEIGDIDGDGFADLLVGSLASPVRLYINRSDGRLEDRSFVFLPSTDPLDASSVDIADWDGDCVPDVVVGRADGASALSWLGSEGGSMREEPLEAAASAQLFFADVDDDGRRDLVTVDGTEGILWVKR